MSEPTNLEMNKKRPLSPTPDPSTSAKKARPSTSPTPECSSTNAEAPPEVTNQDDNHHKENGNKSNKRPLTPTPGTSTSAAKKPRPSPSPESGSTTFTPTHPAEIPTPDNPNDIFCLSDEVIQMILLHLNHVDLFHFALTSAQLNRVASDPMLWNNVDTRHAKPMPIREFKQLIKYCHANTKAIIVQGTLKKSIGQRIELKNTLTPHLLSSIIKQCPNLEEFALEDVYLDVSKISLDMLPAANLTSLSLAGSELVNMNEKESWLKDMNVKMPHLKKINFRNCGWLSNHSIMALGKNQKLEELNLRGCFRMGECYAYTALACRFGFRSLKKLDLRDTLCSNVEVPSFTRLPEMQQILFGWTTSREEARAAVPHSEGSGEITDDAVRSTCILGNTASSSKVETMSLANTDVSDRFITRLATFMPHLKWLDVRGTGVTKAGAEAVRGIRADCEVLVETVESKIHKPGNEPQGQEVVIFMNANGGMQVNAVNGGNLVPYNPNANANN